MEALASDKDSFIQALLTERDRLFQENSRLKSKLEDKTDVESLKSSYEETISHPRQKILSLDIRLPIFSVVYGESPVNALSRKTLSSAGWILMVWNCCPKKRKKPV